MQSQSQTKEAVSNVVEGVEKIQLQISLKWGVRIGCFISGAIVAFCA